MQTDLGGFSYWPGTIDSSWWASMYAVFALQTALQGGIDVPKHLMEKALKYVRQQLFSMDWNNYRDALWTRELAILNLAMAQMVTPQELAGFLDRYDELTDQSKALLLMSAKKIAALPDSRLREMLKRLNPAISRAAGGIISIHPTAKSQRVSWRLWRLEDTNRRPTHGQDTSSKDCDPRDVGSPPQIQDGVSLRSGVIFQP